MNSGKFAVPYYGKLYRDKYGYERIYFIVENNRDEKECLDVGLDVWDCKKEPGLPEWLRNKGVSSIVCRGEAERHITKLMSGFGINILNEIDEDACRLMQGLLV
jgi:hypothetical protein